MESPDFFIMDDDNDLGLSLTCPSSLDEFADSLDIDEVERDPLGFDFELSPPFYSQLHSLFMKPDTSLSLDEKNTSIDLKPSGKYFIKTMKPKRRPSSSVKPSQDESYQYFSSNISNDTEPSQKQPRKLYYCKSCGKSFKFQTSLLRHNNKVHISKYTCPTCQRVFSRQSYLDVHTSKLGSSCYLHGHFHKGK